MHFSATAAGRYAVHIFSGSVDAERLAWTVHLEVTAAAQCLARTASTVREQTAAAEEKGAPRDEDSAGEGDTAVKKLRSAILRFGTARQKKQSLNDGQIQNPSNPFGIVPLSNFVPRGFGFVHHLIAILYLSRSAKLTIRNCCIAVQGFEEGRCHPEAGAPPRACRLLPPWPVRA